MSYRLMVLHCIKMKQVLDLGSKLRLGMVIRPIGAPFLQIKSSKVKEHVSFLGHWESSKKIQINATIILYHSATTMTRDAIIMGRHIREDGVCRKPFLETTDIGSRKMGLEILLEWSVCVACSHNLLLAHNLVLWSPYCIIFVKKAEIAGFLPLTAP